MFEEITYYRRVKGKAAFFLLKSHSIFPRKPETLSVRERHAGGPCARGVHTCDVVSGNHTLF